MRKPIVGSHHCILTVIVLFGYLLVPNSHHPLFSGIPLSIVTTAAVAVAIMLLGSAGLNLAIGRRLALLAVLVLSMKVVTGVYLPAAGYRAEYFADDVATGYVYTRIDRVLDFDARTFRREFFNDAAFANDGRPEARGFAVRWRGAFLLPRPAAVSADLVTSGLVTVMVDGRPLPASLSNGSHVVEVIFRRPVDGPLLLRFALRARDMGISTASILPDREISVSTEPVSSPRDWLLRLYPVVGATLDLVVGGVLCVFVVLVVRRWATEEASNWLAPASVATLFFWVILGAVRTAPYFSVTEFLQRGDDWLGYEITARSILSNGIFAGGRQQTSSFLYPYFVAGLHLVVGWGLWPIYFVQHVVFGFTCALAGLLGKRLWGDPVGAAVTLAVAAYGLLDIARWYMPILLSENLVFPFLPTTFLALLWYVERPRAASACVAGVVLGVTVLSRFNLLPFAAAALGYLVVRGVPGVPRWHDGSKLILAAAFSVTFGLFPLHQRVVTGEWVFLPGAATLNYAGQPGSLIDQWRVSWVAPIRDIFLPNVAFLAGYPKFVVPDYSLRPHWAVLWAGYLGWIWHTRRRTTAFDVLLHLYVVSYLAVMLPNQNIVGYGYRYLLPLFLVMCIVFPSTLVAISKDLAFRSPRFRAIRARLLSPNSGSARSPREK